jgi:hypothetical protein
MYLCCIENHLKTTIIMKTFKITNIDYSGNDFCGEISGEEAVKIFDAQPKELTFSIEDDVYEDYMSYSSEVDSIVCDYCYENGILQPTSFDFDLVD